MSMKNSAHFLSWTGLAVIVACGGAGASGPRTTPTVAVSEPQPDTPGPMPSTASSSKNAQSSPPPESLPERIGPLGLSCSDVDASRGRQIHCDGSGTVAGFSAPVDTVTIPSQATVIHRQEGLPRGGALTVAVHGDLLWIRQVTCGICARIMGWGYVGYPNRLTSQQLAEIQKRVGASSANPLRNTADWLDHFD